MRILIVDDETVSRGKLTAILEDLGECRAVENGKQALAAFQTAWDNMEPFDLICLDVSMPEMDGREALIGIREAESRLELSPWSKTKVVMVTAQADQESVLDFLRAGCNDYIVKPFDGLTVRKKIESLFDRPGRIT
ncbi:MAG: response regulator [Thermodesulfobacteriota bacterium]